MTDNPEILFMVTELIKAYQEDYINKNKTEPTETFVKTSMMSSLLAAETVVELNEFNMHGSLHNVLSEIKLIEDKKLKFENQETKMNFDIPQTANVNQKDTKGTVFYEVCEGQIKEKDKYLDPKFETNFNPQSINNITQKTIQAKLTNGVKNKVSFNLNNYLTNLGTKDISKYDVEKCLKCKVDWKDIGFDLPSLEWSLDFSQLLKTINDAIDKLMKEMDPSKVYDQLCLFIKGFDKFSLCPSQLPQIAAILPALFIKYTNDVMKLQFDWLFLFGPIVKFLTGALANLIENIPKLTKPIIMCLVNGVESMKRFWNFYSDFLKKNGKQIKSIAEGLMLTGQTLYKLVKDKWTFNNDPVKPIQQQNKTMDAPKPIQQQNKTMDAPKNLNEDRQRLLALIDKNVNDIMNLIDGKKTMQLHDETINAFAKEGNDDYADTVIATRQILRDKNYNVSFDISEYVKSFITFADFASSLFYIVDSNNGNSTHIAALNSLVDETLKNPNLLNAIFDLIENPVFSTGSDFVDDSNIEVYISNIINIAPTLVFRYDSYILKDENNEELGLSDFNNKTETVDTFIEIIYKALCHKLGLHKISTNLRKAVANVNNPVGKNISDVLRETMYTFFKELASKVYMIDNKDGRRRALLARIGNDRIIIANLVRIGLLALSAYDTEGNIKPVIDLVLSFSVNQKEESVMELKSKENGYMCLIHSIFSFKNFIFLTLGILKTKQSISPVSKQIVEQVNAVRKLEDKENGVIISFNSNGDPIVIPSNQKTLLEKEIRSEKKLGKVTGPSTFLQKQLNNFLNNNVINPLNESAPNSALLKKYGLEGKVILDKPPELTDYITLYEENIDKPINLVLDNIILALKETQTYIEDFTGSVINALKAINEAFNRKINLTLQLGGRILNIIHTIRFVLLIYKLIQKGFTDCEKISDNVQGAQSIINSINPDMKLDNVTSEEAKNMISNLNPQASNFEGIDEKKYLTITSETNQSSTLINVTDCNNLGSKMRLDNDDNLNRLYEELYNAHITT